MAYSILDFAWVALAVVILDQLSTYYFVKPSQSMFNDPGRYERNKILRRLLRRFGIRGQLVYGPIEFLAILGVMTLTYLLALQILGAAYPGPEWAYVITLMVPLANLLIIVPLNVQGGRKIRNGEMQVM